MEDKIGYLRGVDLMQCIVPTAYHGDVEREHGSVIRPLYALAHSEGRVGGAFDRGPPLPWTSPLCQIALASCCQHGFVSEMLVLALA